jgi:hypothetical protein
MRVVPSRSAVAPMGGPVMGMGMGMTTTTTITRTGPV